MKVHKWTLLDFKGSQTKKVEHWPGVFIRGQGPHSVKPAVTMAGVDNRKTQTYTKVYTIHTVHIY